MLSVLRMFYEAGIACERGGGGVWGGIGPGTNPTGPF